MLLSVRLYLLVEAKEQIGQGPEIAHEQDWVRYCQGKPGPSTIAILEFGSYFCIH